MYHVFFNFFYSFILIIFSMSFASAIEVKENMVLIPSGKYTPLFKAGNEEFDYINVDSFYMDIYPVTNKDFKIFIDNNIEWNKEYIKEIFADGNYLVQWDELKFNDIYMKPVINVSWFAASAYCNFYSKRLPTIDEWEYVASASKNSPVGKDDPKFLQDVLNWYTGNQAESMMNIDSMNSNYWNIYGLHGVVWEWVQDFNSVILINTDAEGGGLEEVLFCGVAAIDAVDPANYVAFMRFAFRNSLQANYAMSSLGFRCAKDIN